MTAPRHAASRHRHAVALWQRYLEPERLPQLDRWLAAELKQQRQFGKQDRSCYSEVLFASVRFGYLAAFLDFVRSRLDPAARDGLAAPLAAAIEPFRQLFGAPAAALAALRRMPPAPLLHLVGRRYEAAGGVGWPIAGGAEVAEKATLDRLFDAFSRYQAETAELAPKLLWAGVPLDLAAPLARRQERGWSESQAAAFLAAQASRPPLWLRLNHPERRAEVLDELERSGLSPKSEGDSLRASGDTALYALRAYQDGLVEIQDWASQQIGLAVDARPGERVWDACAGGGGKTLQIAARLGNRGAVHASDIREYKLKEVRRRAARAHFDNVRCAVWTGEATPPLSREVASHQGFDRVLVDAPCSSSGTWRRNPDAKFRLSDDGLAELTALQGRLLRNAAGAVRPGGQLVYSTCSWLPEEDEAVVERFLAGNPAFELLRESLHGSPEADADTMFSAVLRRRPG